MPRHTGTERLSSRLPVQEQRWKEEWITVAQVSPCLFLGVALAACSESNCVRWSPGNLHGRLLPSASSGHWVLGIESAGHSLCRTWLCSTCPVCQAGEV